MYKRLEQLLIEGLSGASRAVLRHARKENYHTKQNWNTAMDSLDPSAQQYEQDRDREKSSDHFKKAEDHSRQVSKLLPHVPQTYKAKRRRAFAVLRQAKADGFSKKDSLKAFDRVYDGKAGMRLGRLVDEAKKKETTKLGDGDYNPFVEKEQLKSLAALPFNKFKEAASKEGKLVYHSTPSSFRNFKASRSGSGIHFGTEKAAKERISWRNRTLDKGKNAKHKIIPTVVQNHPNNRDFSKFDDPRETLSDVLANEVHKDREALNKAIKDKPAIIYRNRAEDKFSKSISVANPKLIYPYRRLVRTHGDTGVSMKTGHPTKKHQRQLELQKKALQKFESLNRLGNLMLEALSGASKAYKNQTRNWYKHFEKPQNKETKASASKTWGRLKRAKDIVPQSDQRKEARRKPEYQSHYLSKMSKRAIKAQSKYLGEMTDVKDPHSRKCKMCGSVAHRQHKGYKKGFRRYSCSSGTKCNFSWQEREKAAEPKTPTETKRDVNKLGDWADRHHIK
jgi:hypothetical protein